MNDKIEQLQKQADEYRTYLNTAREIRERCERQGATDEEEQWAIYEKEWRIRWATLNRAVRFLKGEIEAEEL